ncbi:MAG TPA: ribbon-helix-helix domain-containing protein [Polyangiaceae bacterium]|jgi:hypothetical protein
MSRKKISTTIYVTPEQADKLKLLHERTKVPVAVYIREGIDLVLKHYGHLLPGQLPLEGAAARNERQAEPRGQASLLRTDTGSVDAGDSDDEGASSSSSSSIPAASGSSRAAAAAKK